MSDLANTRNFLRSINLARTARKGPRWNSFNPRKFFSKDLTLHHQTGSLLLLNRQQLRRLKQPKQKAQKTKRKMCNCRHQRYQSRLKSKKQKNKSDVFSKSSKLAFRLCRQMLLSIAIFVKLLKKLLYGQKFYRRPKFKPSGTKMKQKEKKRRKKLKPKQH